MTSNFGQPGYILILRGERAPKNAILACFGLFWPVFQIFACGTENLADTRVFLVLSESSENQFGRPEKD